MANEENQASPMPLPEQRERDKVRREKLAGYFFDLSKLSFAGMVAGAILPLLMDIGSISKWVVVSMGVVSMVAFAVFGNKLLKY